MRGVSPISIILILIMMIALSLLIYGYIRSSLIPLKFITLLTATCSNKTGMIYLTVKNTNNFLSLNANEELKVFIDGIPVNDITWNPVSVPPNGVTEGNALPPPHVSLALGEKHTILVAGPSNSEERTPVYC